MSWGLLLWLLALCALLALVVQLLRFVRADADLTLLWAEWQGRRPGEDALPPLCTGSPGSVVRSDFRCPSGWRGASGRRGCAFLKGSGSGWKGPAPFVFCPGPYGLCLLLAEVKEPWNRRGAFRSLSSPPGSQGC